MMQASDDLVNTTSVSILDRQNNRERRGPCESLDADRNYFSTYVWYVPTLPWNPSTVLLHTSGALSTPTKQPEQQDYFPVGIIALL